MNIPLMIFKYKRVKFLIKPFLGIGNLFAKITSGMKYDLQEADIKLSVAEYSTLALFNACFFFLLSFLAFFLLRFRIAEKPLGASFSFALVVAFLLFLFFVVVLLRYPKILAGKKAEQIDRTLLFALKDLLLQVSSGVSLYNSFVNISLAGYGLVSKEFKIAAQEINAGIPMTVAIEKMAHRTKSEYLQRSLWQLVNAMNVGASLEGALRTIIDDLARDQKSKIKDYAKELNLWSLIYMLFAVAIPTLGVTMLVVLSGFAGFNVNMVTFAFLMGFVLFVQIAIIGFIKRRRPMVNF
jgi:archaeal flagellar protein FlaJ